MNVGQVLIVAAIAPIVLCGWYIYSLRKEILSVRFLVESILSQFQEALSSHKMTEGRLELRIDKLKAWADSYVAFHENVSKQESARMDDLNARLIQIETENKTDPVSRDKDEDPFNGPRSWAAQSMAASRGEGVEYIA